MRHRLALRSLLNQVWMLTPAWLQASGWGRPQSVSCFRPKL
jgi:hypothetical protein